MLENGILINYMVRPSVHGQMAAVIGGSTRITRMKDMEQSRQLMEGNTRGNSRRVRCTVME